MQNSQQERARFLALWRQIASRYKDRPPSLYFELLNEPHDELDANRWNELLSASLAEIRRTNPDRIVIIGPVQWNNIAALEKLKLPQSDERLVVTFHYYLPFRFTHQGASWAEGSESWVGTTWTGTAGERNAIVTDLDRAAEWARRQHRPLYMGEFGAYSKADMRSRASWTEFLRREAERRGIAWAYWEFASGFGAYDPLKNSWRQPLLDALTQDGP
jgi:endoglucanase